MAAEEESPSEKSSSSIENCINGEDEEEIHDYEKQRLSRIRENRARLAALGLPTLASSLLGSAGKKHLKTKGKEEKKKKASTKTREEDLEYQPSEGEDGESSSAEEEDNEDNKDSGGNGSSGSRKRSSSFVRKVGFILPLFLLYFS